MQDFQRHLVDDPKVGFLRNGTKGTGSGLNILSVDAQPQNRHLNLQKRLKDLQTVVVFFAIFIDFGKFHVVLFSPPKCAL